MEKSYKKILVAVVGISPQILTETLYALAKHQNNEGESTPWIPEEIHVITTTVGKKKLVQSLFNDGYFAKLCQDYYLGMIDFPKENIHIIKNDDGEFLDDIQTKEDNDWAADMITDLIGHLCQNPNTELHVSIAGGRKTMGFYMGYALSLFGRQQDRLSHVLVSPPFENNPGFFYPTREDDYSLTDKRGLPLTDENGEPANTKEAIVTLAEIPFVRMQKGLPNLNFNDNWEYAQIVALTQAEISNFRVTINVPNYELHCKITDEESITITLSPQLTAIYASIAYFRKLGKDIPLNEALLKSERAHHFCNFSELAEKYIEFNTRYKHFSPAEKEEELAKLTSKEFLDIVRIANESRSRIEKLLHQHLHHYTKYFAYQNKGRKRGSTYLNLAINPKNITLIT